jgi:flavin reductase (DIM6/NTAB) family NADH-FMN oxidoreductase RutF
MLTNFDAISGLERYHLMTQVIVPRPIAWILTPDSSAFSTCSYNLAPYSYFNAVSSAPPLIMFSAGHKPDGEQKDTRYNFVEHGYAVIHIPSVADMQDVSASAATLPHGDSEQLRQSLELTRVEGWHLPRLEKSKIAMLCSFYEQTLIGDASQAVLYGKVESLYVDDAIVAEDAKGRPRVNAEGLDPLSRLGADSYGDLGQVLRLKRPA